MTENIGQLVEALAKAKASIKAPKKGRTANAGKYTYHYADRADVIESYQQALAENGLALVHAVVVDEAFHTVLHSRLYHSSGAYVGTSYPIPNVDDAQTLGSWLTYLERYASCALLDIAAEDDDDGARAKKAPARQEEDASPENTPNYDLRLAIKEAAEELEQRGGGLWPEHVRKASAFKNEAGKEFSFSDPFKKSLSEKWLKGTHSRLVAQLAESEPGSAEAADLFT